MTSTQEITENDDQLPITVAVVDDHPVLAEGMANAINSRPNFAVSGVAHTVAAALALIEKTRPAIVLLDYVLPDGDGIGAAKEILQRWPDTKILMVSGIRQDGLLEEVVRIGCVGLIGKDGNTEALFKAIQSVAMGEAIVPSDDVVGRRGAFVPGETTTGLALTAREYEILRHLARRTPTEEIAAELSLSIHTVRNHVRNIFMKLGAHSKLEAVAIAARDRILPKEAIG